MIITKKRFGFLVDNGFKSDDILIFLAASHHGNTCQKCKK